VATSNAALMCGARVDFVDVDPDTLNLSVGALRQKLSSAARTGGLPKVVVPVHMCGQSCDMEPIRSLGRKYGFRIVEDASHAIGATYNTAPVGSCEFSDIAVFSFHPVKIITTGEGGALITNSVALASRLELLRSHGVTKNPADLGRGDEGPWYCEQHALGYNYRMTDIQAALGLSQFTRLDDIVDRRNQLAERYHQQLSGSVRPLTVIENCRSSYHLYVIRVEKAVRRQLFEYLRERDIGVQVHYFPIHLQPYYQRLGFSEGCCPVAEAAYEEIMSIPMFPTLTDGEQEQVINLIRQFYVA
jgi:dTDP-4-amino-4,6-dideoxygalactose transaminase